MAVAAVLVVVVVPNTIPTPPLVVVVGMAVTI